MTVSYSEWMTLAHQPGGSPHEGPMDHLLIHLAYFVLASEKSRIDVHDITEQAKADLGHVTKIQGDSGFKLEIHVLWIDATLLADHVQEMMDHDETVIKGAVWGDESGDLMLKLSENAEDGVVNIFARCIIGGSEALGLSGVEQKVIGNWAAAYAADHHAPDRVKGDDGAVGVIAFDGSGRMEFSRIFGKNAIDHQVAEFSSAIDAWASKAEGG